jgi:hypothetical protein
MIENLTGMGNLFGASLAAEGIAAAPQLKPDTEVLPAAYHLIPLESIRALARVFREGVLKYNERAINSLNLSSAVFSLQWQDERFTHAVEHLFKGYEGDTTEDHFAKVMWYCAVLREIRRLEEKGTNQAKQKLGEVNLKETK